MNKKTVALISALLLCLSLCACGKRESSELFEEQESEPIDFSNAVTVVSTPVPAAETPAVVYTPEPVAAVATAAPTVSPSPTPTVQVVYSGVIKNPTSETVESGGTAIFIAYTDTSNAATWIIKDPGEVYGYDASQAASKYPGLVVSGQGTNTLTLSNIPAEMSGCRIQAHFGTVYTDNANLTVIVSVDSPVRQMANSCLAYFDAQARLSGYTAVSPLQSYSYTDAVSEGGPKASFNISFTSANGIVVAQFTATSAAYTPVSACAYDSSWNVRGFEDYTGSSTAVASFTAFLSNWS